jgi:hypothetical protein
MGGGLLQLRAYGTENLYLNGNPQVSYFKTAYKRHTHFAVQPIEVPFETLDSITYAVPTRIKMKVPRNADLMSKFFINITIPQVNVPRTKSPFRWIPYLGAQMIQRVRVLIGGTVIEELTGEFINLYHQTHLSNEQLETYYELIGHSSEMNNPKDSWGNYPYVDSTANTTNVFSLTEPYINAGYKRPYTTPEKRLSIPIPLWFHRQDGCALPLIALQYHDVVIEVDFRPIRELYQVATFETVDLSASRYATNTIESATQITRMYWTRPNSTTTEFSAYSSQGLNTLSINPVADIHYIFLSADERVAFAKSEHQYLIERVQLYQELGVKNRAAIEVETYHPVKTMYIVCRRNDRDEYNDWSNYTNIDSPDMEPSKYQSYFFRLAKELATADPSGGNVFRRLGQFRTNENRTSNLTMTIDLTTYTIRKEEAYTTSQIRDFLNVWDKRSYLNIPVIDDTNTGYYTQDIIQTTEIIMNGNPFIDAKRASYFQTIQPFMYHTNKLPSGVTMFSFALKPEQYQPSGSCNFSEINKLEFYHIMKDPTPIEPNVAYDIHYHLVQQNVLRIMGGMGSLVYSN